MTLPAARLKRSSAIRSKATTVENIPENADAERVLRDLAQQGNKLIFATSFGDMNSVLKVAKEFPDVKFEHATGYKTCAQRGQLFRALL